MSEPLMYAFSPEHLVVVVHVEGVVYSFTKDSASMLTNPRTRAIVRALLNAAIDDVDSEVKS